MTGAMRRGARQLGGAFPGSLGALATGAGARRPRASDWPPAVLAVSRSRSPAAGPVASHDVGAWAAGAGGRSRLSPSSGRALALPQRQPSGVGVGFARPVGSSWTVRERRRARRALGRPAQRPAVRFPHHSSPRRAVDQRAALESRGGRGVASGLTVQRQTVRAAFQRPQGRRARRRKSLCCKEIGRRPPHTTANRGPKDPIIGTPSPLYDVKEM